MLRSVFSKSLWERRWGLLAWVLGGLTLTAFIVAIYPIVRDNAGFAEVIEQIPEEMLSLFGIDPAIFTTGFGYLQAQMYTLLAPLLVLILAIGFGAAATASEEESGTSDLLLTTPTSRTRVVAEKAAAMGVAVTLLVLSLAVVLLIGEVAVDLRLAIRGIVGIHVGVLLLGLFFGSMAMAIGAWTGRRSIALAVAGAVAAATFFVNGLAPLVEGLQGIQKLMPFHWYLTGDPLQHGPTTWHLLLAAGVGLFTGAAAWLFGRRDLGVAPAIRLLPHRRGGTGSVGSSRSPLLNSVAGKAIWDRRRSFWWWLAGIGSLAALTISFFPSLTADGASDAFQQLLDAYPPEMLAIFGITDPDSVFTGAGFVSTRVYSSIGVIVVLSFAIGMGRAALAGEEREGTADLLLTTPITRDRVVGGKALSMVLLLLGLMAGLAVVVALGDLAVGLDIGFEGLVAANLGLALLGLLFGTVALAVGAVTGSPGRATAAAAGAAVVGFLLNGFGSVIDWLEPIRPLSPFYWYQGDTSPLAASLGWQQPLLLAVSLALTAVALLAFRKRDIGT